MGPAPTAPSSTSPLAVWRPPGPRQEPILMSPLAVLIRTSASTLLAWTSPEAVWIDTVPPTLSSSTSPLADRTVSSTLTEAAVRSPLAVWRDTALRSPTQDKSAEMVLAAQLDPSGAL